MEELIGCKILDLEVCDGEHCLRFTTDKGTIAYLTEGDCCSETWFSEIINLDFLIDNIVLSVEELSLPNCNREDGNCRQEVDRFYGFSLCTKNGHTTIVFRNSSNGYYGGSCTLLKEDDSIEKLSLFVSIKHLGEWTAYQPTNKSYVHTLKLKAFL